MKPLAVDLCCGLGGWTHGLLAEEWDVVGFDIERHIYGEDHYPAQLVFQDIRTIDGRQFRGKVKLITASPPCQEFSYMAMPWQRGKQIARALRGDGDFPDGYTGSRTVAELTALFDACVRIDREAECPIVIENVRGAQPWIGRSRWNFGSFHLYGDVPALMPMTKRLPFKGGDRNLARASGGHQWNTESWFNIGSPGQKETNQNPVHDGVKQHKSGRAWFADPDSISGGTGSKSKARKAASAAIAKIPFALARHIAAYWKPSEVIMNIAR